MSFAVAHVSFIFIPPEVKSSRRRQNGGKYSSRINCETCLWFVRVDAEIILDFFFLFNNITSHDWLHILVEWIELSNPVGACHSPYRESSLFVVDWACKSHHSLSPNHCEVLKFCSFRNASPFTGGAATQRFGTLRLLVFCSSSISRDTLLHPKIRFSKAEIPSDISMIPFLYPFTNLANPP